MKINVHIEKDKSGYYVAEVPALPGCLSQGRTLSEAKANIKEAVGAWLMVMEEKAKCHHHRSREVAISVRVKD